MSIHKQYHCTTLVKAIRLWWKLREHWPSIKVGRTGWIVATVTGPPAHYSDKYFG